MIAIKMMRGGDGVGNVTDIEFDQMMDKASDSEFMTMAMACTDSGLSNPNPCMNPNPEPNPDFEVPRPVTSLLPRQRSKAPLMTTL